jgi:hypothetical protein
MNLMQTLTFSHPIQCKKQFSLTAGDWSITAAAKAALKHLNKKIHCLAALIELKARGFRAKYMASLGIQKLNTFLLSHPPPTS